MKGQVLHYDDNTGIGQISGDDGIRYNFTRSDLKRLVPISAGTQVDFDFDGRDARDIYVISKAVGGFGATATAYGGAIEPDLGFFGYFRRAMTSYFFNFSGRARRKEYWGFWVFPLVIYAILGIMAAMAFAGQGSYSSPSGVGIFLIIVLVIFFLATIIPGIAVQVRRLHDIGQSGWILLILIVISLIPYLGLLSTIAYIVLGCIDSQPGENKYGPPPKQVG